jgi:hypothetical protein
LLDWVAGAVVVAGAALCASAGAVNMVAAISTAANFLNMVVSFCCAPARCRMSASGRQYAEVR